MGLSRWIAVFVLFVMYCQANAATATATGSTSTPATGLRPARADANEAEPWRVSVYWQNDGTWIKPNHDTDRHYTNGAAISFSYHPQWARQVAKWMPLADSFGPARTAGGLILGQLIFTPTDLQTKAPLPNDAPYAGYLFGGVFWQRANANTLDHVQLDLGLVGPDALGEQVQNLVHRLRGFKTARGWNNQLHDEVTGELYLRRKWRFDTGTFDLGDWRLQSQVIPQAGLAVGTVYRYAQGGALFRIGANLPDDFGPGELQDVGSATGVPVRGWSVYGFGRVLGRAGEHNLFLQGNTFADSPSVDAKPLVGDVEAGLAVAYGGPQWTAGLVYSQTFMSKQFDGEQGTDAYGSLTLSVTGRF